MSVGVLLLIVCFFLYITDELDSDALSVLILIALIFYYPLAAGVILGLIALIYIIKGCATLFEKLENKITFIEEKKEKYKDNKALYFIFDNFGILIPIAIAIIGIILY